MAVVARASAFFAPRRFNLIDFQPSASCAATLTLLSSFSLWSFQLGTVTRRAQNELDAASPAATIPEAAEGESLVSTTVSDLFAHYTFWRVLPMWAGLALLEPVKFLT